MAGDAACKEMPGGEPKSRQINLGTSNKPRKLFPSYARNSYKKHLAAQVKTDRG